MTELGATSASERACAVVCVCLKTEVNMGVATNPRTLLLQPMGDMIAGVVGMSNCRFVRCRFVQVGFTGAPDLLEQIEADLLSARAVQA